MTASTGPTSLLLKDDKVVSVKNGDNYRSSNIGGPGHADQVISGDVIKNSSSISTGLNGLAHGIIFSGAVPILQTGGTISGMGGGSEGYNPMLVVVDGVEVGKGVPVDLYSPGRLKLLKF